MTVHSNRFLRLYNRPVLVAAVLAVLVVVLLEPNSRGNKVASCFQVPMKSFNLSKDKSLRRFAMYRWKPRRSTLRPLFQTKTTKAIIITEERQSSISTSINVIDETNRWINDGNRSYDLSSPREWLESSPQGVYTVIRCDLQQQQQSPSSISVHDKSTNYQWRVWGIEFHLQRLIDSGNLIFGAVEDQPTVRNRTLAIVHDCLRSAEKYWIQSGDEIDKTFMVTILWHPDQTDTLGSKSRINVTAHVLPTSYSSSPIQPLSLVIASPSSLYPSRKSTNPQAKFSSWCIIRRPLENAFQILSEPKEIILIDETIDGDVTLLEGLTSNLFCVYKPDNVVRTTATTEVLAGFSQQIVIDTASELGYTVDLETPIRLSDASLWKEVFTTSSVKIMTPIRRVVIPLNNTACVASSADNQLSFEEIWSFEYSNTHSGCTFQKIHDYILHNYSSKICHQCLDQEVLQPR